MHYLYRGDKILIILSQKRKKLNVSQKKVSKLITFEYLDNIVQEKKL